MTEVLSPDLRYRLMLFIVYAAGKHEKDPSWPLFSAASAFAAGLVADYGWLHEDVDIALREMVVIGHCTLDGWHYRPTPAGIAWVEVEAAVRQSAMDARTQTRVDGR